MHHLAVVDIRNILKAPATVVVSTIVPDRPTTDALDAPPYLLVAVENLDARLTEKLGSGFTFPDLRWITGKTPPGYSSLKLAA